MSIRPMWQPSAARIAASNMHRFLDQHTDRIRSQDYAGLHEWSVTEPAEFWRAISDFCEIRFSHPATSIVDDFDKMPGTRWFVGAKLNYAENLLDRKNTGTALIVVNEREDRLELSFDELRRQVASIAAALRSAGVRQGDRVAGILPNRHEAVVAALATASLGAIWSSCSPDFGQQALLDRLKQIEPKVLFGTDGYFYAGKRINCLPTLHAVAEKLDRVTTTIVTAYTAPDPDVRGLPGGVLYDDLLGLEAELEFTQVPFDHPLFILYSSGTTGAPKCIVHSVGGTLIQHCKEHVLHTDIKPGDTFFYFTTCGWMMWNWLLSSLASGASLVLYDGSPFHPNPGALWQMAERESIDVFGTSARYLAAVEKSGYLPGEQFELGPLRSILSTGSPLAPMSFDFVYESIKRDLQLASIAGGTDLISCFVLGNPMLPVYRGEIQSCGLGMDVKIFDADGRAIIGEKGELVCLRPFPSMPLGFWNDPDQSKYRHAYFERYDNVWWHGDYAELTEHDGIVMHGRSDTVLNAGGVRIGTAEIYRIVEALPEIEESIAVAQDWGTDTRVVLFVQLRESIVLDKELVERIKRALRERGSPRHVPAQVLAVPEIPRTISGKISESAVRDVIHARPVDNIDALANPNALDHFRDRVELTQ